MRDLWLFVLLGPWALRAEEAELAVQSSCRVTGVTEEVRGSGSTRDINVGVASIARLWGRHGGWETVIPRA